MTEQYIFLSYLDKGWKFLCLDKLLRLVTWCHVIALTPLTFMSFRQV